MTDPVVFIPTDEIPDVSIVETRIFPDDRGFFTEAYSYRNWSETGFNFQFVQDNLSMSSKGTLRGLHYQVKPFEMGKLIRVLSGSIFDVAVDIRRGSPTFGKWVGRVLSAENKLAMWVPPGFAHGFLALEDDSLILYKCTEHYVHDAERVIMYKDPKIGVVWPSEATNLSERDLAAPLLDEAEYNFSYEEQD